MTIAITGVNLPTHATGGSYAAMTEQSAVATSVRQADAEIDSTQTRAQVLKPWAEKNWGDADLAPWPHWDVKRPEEKMALADAMGKLGQALEQLKKASPKVDVETLLEDAGIPMMSEAELASKDDRDMERRKKMGLVPNPAAPGQPPQAPGAAPGQPPQKPPAPPAGDEKAKLSDEQDFLDNDIVEEIADETVKQLAQDLYPFVQRLMERIDTATTVEEIKAIVLEELADDEGSPEAVETLERAMLLVHLAGVAAASEE
jgi:hypothetical protein